MFGFFKKSEKLETRAGYTEQLITAYDNAATGKLVNIQRTAVKEIAAGVWGRAFATAEIDPPELRNVVTPSILSMIGRQLIENGNALFEIVVNGELSLRPVDTWDIYGSPDPMTWEYQLSMPGPSTTIDKRVPGNQVVHVRYGETPLAPWEGCSPLESADTSAKLYATIEKQLLAESGTVHGNLLPLPDRKDFANLRSDLANLNGGLAPVQSTSTSFESARQPMGDWKPQRLGMNTPASTISLRMAVCETLLSACGIPGMSLDREAYRQLLHSTISPIGKIIEKELSEKLEQDIELDFTGLYAADIQGRGRAFKSMTDGGIKPEYAARICGFDTGSMAITMQSQPMPTPQEQPQEENQEN